MKNLPKKIQISGTVRKHNGRGRKLGFPTANIDLRKALAEGIYAGRVYVGGSTGREALIFIGIARTFGERARRAEIYILNFRGNLYGKKIRAEILKKLRANKKFSSSAALVAQMKKDLVAAKKYFNTLKKESR